MLLSTIYNDLDFTESKIPEGYILVFYSLDDKGNVVKRYKDSNGKFGNFGSFGNLGGSGNQDIPNDVANQQITQILNSIEQTKDQVYVQLVEATSISNQLDQIIGENI